MNECYVFIKFPPPKSKGFLRSFAALIEAASSDSWAGQRVLTDNGNRFQTNLFLPHPTIKCQSERFTLTFSDNLTSKIAIFFELNFKGQVFDCCGGSRPFFMCFKVCLRGVVTRSRVLVQHKCTEMEKTHKTDSPNTIPCFSFSPRFWNAHFLRL